MLAGLYCGGLVCDLVRFVLVFAGCLDLLSVVCVCVVTCGFVVLVYLCNVCLVFALIWLVCLWFRLLVFGLVCFVIC